MTLYRLCDDMGYVKDRWIESMEPKEEPPMSQTIEEKIRDHVCDTLGVPRGQVAEPVREDEVVGLMPAPEPPKVK